MMGHLPRTESLFYYFRLEEQIPEDHLLRLIDRHIDLSFVREQLKGLYSSTGRPSIDPEVLLRLLLVGYLYGITSERRLVEEVRMHLAYRWFTRLDFEQEIPDHSTFSKNRHGRFRQSGVFREVFEHIVRRCLEAGLVEGKNLAVDGTLVGADASRQSRVRREPLQAVGLTDSARVLGRAGKDEPGVRHRDGFHHRPGCDLGHERWGNGGDGLLRQLSYRHRESGNSWSGSYASAFPSGDGGCAKDARTSREAGRPTGESGC